MVKSLSILLISATVLTSCGAVRESRINPFNWFGRSEPVAVQTVQSGTVNPLIPARRRNPLGLRTDNTPVEYTAPPIAEVTELLIERRTGGAIIRATGQSDVVGPFDVRMTLDEAASGNGTLAYTLRAFQTPGPRSTGPLARLVTAAVYLTDQDLAGISTIRVAGRENALASRR